MNVRNIDMEQNKHGGARPGAGRKKNPTGQKSFHLLLDSDMYERAKSLKNKNRFFNEAIREKFDKEEKP